MSSASLGWPAGRPSSRTDPAQLSVLACQIANAPRRGRRGTVGRGAGAAAVDGQHGFRDAAVEGADRGEKEARRARQQSQRERRKDRKRGGQPGHQGKACSVTRTRVRRSARIRRCSAVLAGQFLDSGEAVRPRWAQVIDAEIVRKVTEWLLPGLLCPWWGTATFAEPPPGAHAGVVSSGPVLKAAAVPPSAASSPAKTPQRLRHGTQAGSARRSARSTR